MASSTTPARTAPTSVSPCPCGSGRTFGECCEPVLKDVRKALTAEALMRSRFTAHVVGDFLHLHRTYLGTARKPYTEEKGDLDGLGWTRLVVHAHDVGPKPDQSFVDFTAYYREGDTEHALHEKSEFQRIDGAWFYTRAVRLGPAPVKAAPKVGRNDPCPCGSGKKFKQCCGK
jgi:SEC-C motif-containing protein